MLMRTIGLILAVTLVAAPATQPAGCKAKGAAPNPGSSADVAAAKSAAKVAFRLYVYENDGSEHHSTDEEGFAAIITLSGIATDPDAVVLFTDVKTGAQVPGPYEYVADVPHVSSQVFGPDIVSVSFTADMILLPGWKMECYTNDLTTNRTVMRNSIKNTTSMHVDEVLTCTWP